MAALAYLGLGANLGDAVQQIVDARHALQGLSSTISLRCSYLYLSSPVGYAKQDDFINCVVELITSAKPIELLDEMQRIENEMGRKRVAGNQNAPRLIDIDLLLFDSQTIDEPRLSVPHPRLTERLFVLKPLLELLDSSDYQRILNNGDFTGQQLTRLRLS